MKNLPTLRDDSSFAVQFSISVSKKRTVLLFIIKIIEMFELHASMPTMRSAEYQAKIPLKLYIIKRIFRQSTNQNHYHRQQTADCKLNDTKNLVIKVTSSKI